MRATPTAVREIMAGFKELDLERWDCNLHVYFYPSAKILWLRRESLLNEKQKDYVNAFYNTPVSASRLQQVT